MDKPRVVCRNLPLGEGCGTENNTTMWYNVEIGNLWGRTPFLNIFFGVFRPGWRQPWTHPHIKVSSFVIYCTAYVLIPLPTDEHWQRIFWYSYLWLTLFLRYWIELHIKDTKKTTKQNNRHKKWPNLSVEKQNGLQSVLQHQELWNLRKQYPAILLFY